jgi:hypothetical protein
MRFNRPSEISSRTARHIYTRKDPRRSDIERPQVYFFPKALAIASMLPEAKPID